MFVDNTFLLSVLITEYNTIMDKHLYGIFSLGTFLLWKFVIMLSLNIFIFVLMYLLLSLV